MIQVVGPMLARLERQLPRGAAWRYEPKLDGFRGLLVHNRRQVQLLSRNMRDLAVYFPEIAGAGRALPNGTVVDGEIVIADDTGRADFSALQDRLVTARRRAAATSHVSSAVLLVFDVLSWAGQDWCNQPLRERRTHLEHELTGTHERLQLVEQTDDVSVAQEWLRLLPIEGVVAKHSVGRYAPGQREWVKVKRQLTADCVVIGLAGEAEAPSLVLGLRHADGQLHHFGVTRSSTAPFADPCAPTLELLADEPAIPSRWQHDAVPAWRRVAPTAVCEVAYTVLDGGGRWLRHPARFLRWRPDRAPADCAIGQLR